VSADGSVGAIRTIRSRWDPGVGGGNTQSAVGNERERQPLRRGRARRATAACCRGDRAGSNRAGTSPSEGNGRRMSLAADGAPGRWRTTGEAYVEGSRSRTTHLGGWSGGRRQRDAAATRRHFGGGGKSKADQASFGGPGNPRRPGRCFGGAGKSSPLSVTSNREPFAWYPIPRARTHDSSEPRGRASGQPGAGRGKSNPTSVSG
jgi:hypothetical protein